MYCRTLLFHILSYSSIFNKIKVKVTGKIEQQLEKSKRRYYFWNRNNIILKWETELNCGEKNFTLCNMNWQKSSIFLTTIFPPLKTERKNPALICLSVCVKNFRSHRITSCSAVCMLIISHLILLTVCVSAAKMTLNLQSSLSNF